MPPDPRDIKLLWDMHSAGTTAAGFIEGQTFEQFSTDVMLKLAIERSIEIVGEAARHVSPEGRAQLPMIPWGAIVATRHILAHDYDDIDQAKIWRIASVHLPELVAAIRPILDANPPGPEASKPLDEP